MVIIPGFIVSLLTFPGVVVHEWAHKIACNFFGVRVLKIAYFIFNFSLVGGEAGYVIHERPSRYLESLCISAAPLFVNTAVTLVCGLLAYTSHIHRAGPLEALFLWLGFSIGVHAFPSNQDMANVNQHANREHFLIGALSQTLYAVMIVLNFLKRFWLDFVYAYVVMRLVYGNQL